MNYDLQHSDLTTVLVEGRLVADETTFHEHGGQVAMLEIVIHRCTLSITG